MTTQYEKQLGVLGLLLGPFIGLAYVIALPFIAIGTVAVLVGKKLVVGIVNLVETLVFFGWHPAETYLGGKKKGKKKNDRKTDSS